jgi:hypothetical protein
MAPLSMEHTARSGYKSRDSANISAHPISHQDLEADRRNRRRKPPVWAPLNSLVICSLPKYFKQENFSKLHSATRLAKDDNTQLQNIFIANNLHQFQWDNIFNPSDTNTPKVQFFQTHSMSSIVKKKMTKCVLHPDTKAARDSHDCELLSMSCRSSGAVGFAVAVLMADTQILSFFMWIFCPFLLIFLMHFY